MSLITLEELARGACIAVGGGLAGTLTIAMPGSPLWLLPAGAALAGCALTVPEIRTEVVRSLPMLADAAQQVRRALPMPQKRDQAPQPSQPRAQPDHPAPQPQRAPAQTPPPLRARPRWLEVVNDNPDLTPHALILGGSGVGKTTMATAIMNDRGGRTVVISPKVSAGGWAGAEVVSLDDDGSYAPITAALQDLEDEKRRRVVTLRQHGPDALEPLTIVMDELVDLTAREPRAGEMMVNLSSLGREIKMRLVGIGTTDKALGIKGWASSRNNYVTIQMDQQRRATITQGERTMTVPAQDTLARATGAQLRPWRGEPEPAVYAATETTQRLQPVETPADDLLIALLALPADVRRAVPNLSPERAERLARVLNQGVQVARDGGDVHVHVQQTSVAPPAARQRTTGRGGISVKDRRRRLEYIEAARRGDKFDPTFKRLGGSRNEMHALFTAHKTVLARPDAK